MPHPDYNLVGVVVASCAAGVSDDFIRAIGTKAIDTKDGAQDDLQGMGGRRTASQDMVGGVA